MDYIIFLLRLKQEDCPATIIKYQKFDRGSRIVMQADFPARMVSAIDQIRAMFWCFDLSSQMERN